MFTNRLIPSLAFFISCGFFSGAQASAYYMIYSPTVEYGETEIELYAHRNNDDDPVIDGSQTYVFEVAKGVTPKLFLEGKVIANKTPGSSTEVEEYAVEGVYQLTEQGEYDWTFGLLGEVVYSTVTDEISEVEFGGLFATDIGTNMTFTANLIAEYENAEDKFEGSGSAQLKWRLGPAFEPAIEIYSSEYSTLAGPVAMGKFKAGNNKFGYEIGILFGLDDKTPDNTLKAMIEYEF